MMKRIEITGYPRGLLVALAGGATYLIAIVALMMPVVEAMGRF